MRVAVVSHAYSDPVNHDKLRALARLPNVELTLVVPAAWRRQGVSRAPAPQETLDYRVLALPVIFPGRIGAYFFRSGLGELRRVRPDVIHVEAEPWSLAALQCVLVSREAPVVLFTWENFAGPRRWLQRAVERIVLRRVAFVIAGNRGARARMLRLGVQLDRLAVLPQFGVDVARYAQGDPTRVEAPFPVAPPRPRPVVGFVGRLEREKGVDLLLAALDSRLDAAAVIVGDGRERRALERAVGRSGQAVHFAGAVPSVRIPDWLSAMDVLVLPSRTTPYWAEQFGHVLIEAMAAGVAVIGSSCGAIPEVIGDAGLIFPEEDVDVLRAQLVRLLRDDALRAELVARGRARVRSRFSHDVIVRAQREIYMTLLGGLRGAGR